MANSPVVAIGITFRDRDGNRAKATCYCAFATPVADAWGFAFAMAARMEAISNALLYKVELAWRYTIDSPALASASADLERKLLLLVMNEDDEINAMIIPSPSDNWETTGSYAGIRLDLTTAPALAFVAMLESMDLRTDDNRPLGIELTVGGLAL